MSFSAAGRATHSSIPSALLGSRQSQPPELKASETKTRRSEKRPRLALVSCPPEPPEKREPRPSFPLSSSRTKIQCSCLLLLWKLFEWRQWWRQWKPF
ncbi:unnamed protein product [Urochloa humidicola]